jgi:cytochrome c oxidase subunit 2
MVLLLTACSGDTSILQPNGPAASQMRLVWWVLFGLAALMFVFTMTLLVIALRHTPEDDRIPTDESPNTDESFMGSLRFVFISGIGIPAVVLFIVIGLTLVSMQALRVPEDETAMTIEVVGHQFWWEVRYPDYDVTTANEFHIPINTPVKLELYTDDVIHSFWVPELQGKMDMIPGIRNETWLEASRPGTYEGICTEFCGLQHANMRFFVTAQSQENFDTWMQEQQRPARLPQDDDLLQRGWQVFQNEGRCAECHAIRGTNATGDLGPDLTHLAGREWLGAGVVPNTEGYLSGWVIDPQSMKPGVLMPAIDLDGDDLQALVAFLQTLD